MSRLPASVRSQGRLFAFFLGNRTLAADILVPGSCDLLSGADDPGLGSALEQAFAIFLNVLDVDAAGQVTNAEEAMRRAAQWVRSYCDPAYEVEPPFDDWETELV